MTARQQRRHAERKARKDAYKAQKQAAAATAAAVQPVSPEESLDFSSEPAAPTRPETDTASLNKLSSPSPRGQINRQNAQHSTGPKTPEGKAISAMNRFRHGLAGNFALLDWEKEENYYNMLWSLQEEHQPETMTEYLLVERMAQHQWLSQRAVCLQNFCFRVDVPLCEQEKELALYLRYQTTHDRAFHKCLAELLKLRAQKLKEQYCFESQKRRQAAETRKQELHETKLQALRAKQSALKSTAKPPAIVPQPIERSVTNAIPPLLTSNTDTEMPPAALHAA